MSEIARFLEIFDNWFFALAWPLPLGIVVAVMALFALIAFVQKALDFGGSLGAFVFGVIVMWTTGLGGLLLFLFFFVGANLVGKISTRLSIGVSRKEAIGVIEKKGSRRNVMQVLANGLMAVLAGLAWYVSRNLSSLVMFGAAIAEAFSDTLAGDIGKLSKKQPVSIKTLLPVKKGLSGGVTVLGLVAAFGSALAIGAFWWMFFGVKNGLLASSIVCLTGFMGCIVDSYLGACVQAQYRDTNTGELTEEDSCNGQPFELVRGVRWVDNDMINLMSNVFSAVFAYGMASFLF